MDEAHVQPNKKFKKEQEDEDDEEDEDEMEVVTKQEKPLTASDALVGMFNTKITI